MSLFDVLAQFIQIFVDMIPRFARRPASTEWMIVDSMYWGPHVMRRPVVYVPIFDHVEYWPNTEQPIDPDIQTLTTKDNLHITVRPGFSFRIIEPLVTRANWGNDYEARVAMAARGVVQYWYSKHTLDELHKSGDDGISEEIEQHLLANGVELAWFCVEEHVATDAVRVFGIDIISSLHN